MLLPAALLGAVAAAAQNAPAPQSGPPAAMIVIDASSSMSAKIGGATKIAAAKEEVGAALGLYAGRLSFGLVAFGHRKASNCADSEILAKPGELTYAAKDKLFDKIKPKGQAPVAAALSDAAKAAQSQSKLDIVLIADGGDSCDADLCSTAVAMKEKAPGLRIHVLGVSGKEDEIKPLACVAAATGGAFVAAADASTLKQGLATALDAAAGAAPVAQAAAGVSQPAAPEPPAALPVGVAAAVPIDLDAQAQAATASPDAGDLPPGTVATAPIELDRPAQEGAAAPPQAPADTETAVLKQTPPAQPANESIAPPVNRVQSVPIAPPPPIAEPPTPAAKSAASPPAQPQRPVPVTFKAQISETGPSLKSGLTWRVYASKTPSEGGGFKLLSTHREAMPTAALLPGNYLVNAAYGLSNLTRRIKVEGGRSLEETFVLNTGGLKLAAVLPSGEPLPEGAVKFDILTDEEDQFGNRQAILRDAKPGVTLRLNAGAYRIESLYGDTNAIIKADVTVEPGKVTEATIKQTGAKTTFKLVQSLGGEALADTKWTILTSAGDVVKENAGALPTHILAPGSYAVVADHDGLSYTRKFSIESGEGKQVEVVVEDGPTSPEDLKALTDPPEPEPVSTEGVVAGEGRTPSPEGGMAFDGFSATPRADPNAPLINPGVLLRGAR
ncbi:MAG TPA: VWA domain-containing protein [Methyloceanibacter sp.]|nr:VWA domain-containing protein [Methyloceanibacter sp.]